MDERVRPPESGDERTILSGMLDFLRQTVVHKVSGLTDEQAFARPIGTTELGPASLVKHLTGTERFWFAIDFAAEDIEWPWPDEDPHGGFALDPTDTLADLVAVYQTECVRSRAITAAHPLDAPARGAGMTFNLRYALTHMIEETARHLGHLDLIREATDGQRGQ
ncbi:DinB family protein [Kribbella qitaiheensis]|uniref:DinB family protein n=2 Tax=Kribbella qitaiheensis TaxID=1544730 RepID=A0A7G6X9J0_9ACTN|nr:DinB family protein [Kribbella qitaiheensis]